MSLSDNTWLYPSPSQKCDSWSRANFFLVIGRQQGREVKGKSFQQKRKGYIYLIMGIFQPLLESLLFATELMGCQEKSLKRFRQRLQRRVHHHWSRRHFVSSRNKITKVCVFHRFHESTSARAEAQLEEHRENEKRIVMEERSWEGRKARGRWKP